MEKLIEKLKSTYPLTFKKEEKIKIKAMNFIIRQYYAEGLGNVSTMFMNAPFNVMKMDSLVINPFEIDLPLLSYDRIFAFGNDSMYLELYETRIDSNDKPEYIKNLVSLKNDFSFEVKRAWYTNLLYPESVHMKTKKKNKKELNKVSMEFFTSYLNWAIDTKSCYKEEKMTKARVYTEGLLTNGGPSTDVFLKNMGKEYTEKLFREVVFGTK